MTLAKTRYVYQENMGTKVTKRKHTMQEKYTHLLQNVIIFKDMEIF